MSKHKHKIFAFVGASGSGKSTIMVELLNFFPHLEIIKSTSTRARRDETDDLFYKLVDLDYMNSPANRDLFLNFDKFNGNFYAYERQIADSVLASHCGMFAIIEKAVPVLREQGYDLELIKVVADRDWTHERALEREKADSERANTHDLKFGLTVLNSFKPGGLDKSVQAVAKFITDSIADHHAGN
jgi:guanylate kinase